ncbi:MAG TPA: hypothetical protein VFE53_15940 [Mucilaginibacter sp.]|jgi:hypothetical protein|nr:hypothetical protein [Mucilaginibacter sp.]
MQTLTLAIKNLHVLNTIRENFENQQPLTLNEQIFLSKFLSQLPSDKDIISERIPLNDSFKINVWDTKAIEIHLKSWIALYDNIPGYDYCPLCLLTGDDPELVRQRVIMVANFSPTMAYNFGNGEAYEVRLKDDGTAFFWVPTLDDAERYPELYHFTGSWKEAYLLLIATLQKGWPMEEFPAELQKFLPKQ